MSTIITKRQFPGYHKYELDLAGRPLTLEVGKLAELANSAVMVGYGDTRVLCCVLVLVVLIIALDAVVHLLEWRLLRWRG